MSGRVFAVAEAGPTPRRVSAVRVSCELQLAGPMLCLPKEANSDPSTRSGTFLISLCCTSRLNRLSSECVRHKQYVAFSQSRWTVHFGCTPLQTNRARPRVVLSLVSTESSVLFFSTVSLIFCVSSLLFLYTAAALEYVRGTCASDTHHNFSSLFNSILTLTFNICSSSRSARRQRHHQHAGGWNWPHGVI